MPADRFFSPSPFQVGANVALEDEELRHLLVMRIQRGDALTLVNGQGELATATVTKIDRKSCSLEITSLEKEEKNHRFTLAQAIPRFNRLETILEKGTELGVDTFLLFPGERSEKTEFSRNQLERMETILVAALKQCGRLYLPEIKVVPPLAQLTKLSGTLLFGDVDPHAPRFSHPASPSTFFVGPEAGFTPAEISRLKEWGARGVSLSRNILRVDTAAIAATVVAV
jgi:16S rRNA (uracil1498-N3)-methyltransferase